MTGASPVPQQRAPEDDTGGVVLAYRPRGAARPPQREVPVDAPAGHGQPSEPCVVIHFAGREFVTRESMADLFLRSAGRVVVDGGSQSVPLLHEDGVELLFITPSARVRVTRAPQDE